jgi:elongation factor Ts
MELKRVRLITAGANELLATYSHGDGNIGVSVTLGAENGAALATEALRDLAHDLALHVAAFNPLAISRDNVDQAVLKEQEEIYRAQMEQDPAMAEKPQNVRDGILKGKVNKYLTSICFLDQGFVRDDKLTVAKALEEAGKAAGTKLAIKNFSYMKVGA